MDSLLSNGVPGSPFIATFGVGSSLAYTDSTGKTVQLSLTGAGTIEMFRTPAGDAQSVSLVGAVPRKSVLTLQANGREAVLPTCLRSKAQPACGSATGRRRASSARPPCPSSYKLHATRRPSSDGSDAGRSDGEMSRCHDIQALVRLPRVRLPELRVLPPVARAIARLVRQVEPDCGHSS